MLQEGKNLLQLKAPKPSRYVILIIEVLTFAVVNIFHFVFFKRSAKVIIKNEEVLYEEFGWLLLSWIKWSSGMDSRLWQQSGRAFKSYNGCTVVIWEEAFTETWLSSCFS